MWQCCFLKKGAFTLFLLQAQFPENKGRAACRVSTYWGHSCIKSEDSTTTTTNNNEKYSKKNICTSSSTSGKIRQDETVKFL